MVVRLLTLFALGLLTSACSKNDQPAFQSWGYDSETQYQYYLKVSSQVDEDQLSETCVDEVRSDANLARVYDAAVTAQGEGNFGQALKHRMCLHVQGAPFDGSRAASIILKWGDLPNIYPPAETALRNLQAIARINTLAVDELSHLAFNDYLSIARTYDEEEKAMALASEVAAINPELGMILQEMLIPSPEAEEWARSKVEEFWGDEG